MNLPNNIDNPSEWLVHNVHQIPCAETSAILPCLKEAHWCNRGEDLRKIWYAKELKAVLLLAQHNDDLLQDLVCRLVMVLPEAPVVVLLGSEVGHDKLLELGVQDVWITSELTDHLLMRSVAHARIRKGVEYRSRHLAHYDSLTGVANRALFQDRLDHSLLHARREGRIVGLMCVDLDRFSVVNEHYGHDVGDQLLKAFARRLSDIVRRSDTVARLSGNNFAVVLESVANEHVITSIAEKLTEAFRQPYFIGDHEIFCSTSIGIEVAHKIGYDASQLMRRAELALRDAKQDGRNDFRYFSAENYPIDQVRASLESSLHHALDRQELTLQYQPQVKVESGDFIGTEVLLRWTHSTLGPISPAVFIPALEETGLINKVGEWVLSTACHQHQQWIRQGALPNDSKLSVNLSPRQFRQRDLADRVLQVLELSELNPRNLTLEITEGVLMENMEQGIDMLCRLREIGVSVAIDDFGTGYSSLAYLKDLPIDYLKIDRVFVKDIVDDENDAAIANSIIALAHNLGLEVIAEGVEDPNILSILKAFGCDHYQGFFFSRPVDAEELPNLVQQASL